MNKLLPSALVLTTTLALSACSVQQETERVTATTTPVVNLQQQLATPAPSAEPAFRAGMKVVADSGELKVGKSTKVAISLTGLTQSATTFSTTIHASDHLKITHIGADEQSLPLVFKSGVTGDGKSASIAASNGKGFQGPETRVVIVTVEGVAVGQGSLTIDANDTSVLLPDNTNVAPRTENLPSTTINVQ